MEKTITQQLTLLQTTEVYRLLLSHLICASAPSTGARGVVALVPRGDRFEAGRVRVRERRRGDPRRRRAPCALDARLEDVVLEPTLARVALHLGERLFHHRAASGGQVLAGRRAVLPPPHRKRVEPILAGELLLHEALRTGRKVTRIALERTVAAAERARVVLPSLRTRCARIELRARIHNSLTIVPTFPTAKLWRPLIRPVGVVVAVRSGAERRPCGPELPGIAPRPDLLPIPLRVIQVVPPAREPRHIVVTGVVRRGRGLGRERSRRNNHARWAGVAAAHSSDTTPTQDWIKRN
mmetsp:Transcript_5110/g.17775  ORF Transcript_5110/g.17775 Transcript_5110/m.17775 type:complete len:296 (-) Transcript_5110:607-1494(-)